METAFVGEIRAFPYSYAPEGWLNCNGQMIYISAYPALYDVIGTVYGHQGNILCAVRNLACAVPMGTGGASLHRLGQSGGSASMSILPSQIGDHNHLIEQRFTPFAPAQKSFSNAPSKPAFVSRYIQPRPAPTPANTFRSFTDHAPVPVHLAPDSLSEASGGAEQHENRQPYLALRYCICWDGAFPVE